MSSTTRFGLHNLERAVGSVKQAIRVGRGRSSRRGKTAGKGHKGAGQHASGSARLLFEGGQTPFYRRQPKHGFHNPNSRTFDPVNLDDISSAVEAGKIDPNQTITMKILKDAGLIGRQVKHGVKLLARGKEKLATPIEIEVSRASKFILTIFLHLSPVNVFVAGGNSTLESEPQRIYMTAIEAIESVGGSITTVYFNQRTLQALLKAQARPRGKDLEYYSDPAVRGYLSKQSHALEDVD